MWKLQVLGLMVLGCCGIGFVAGRSVQTEGPTASNDGDVVTLSTELKPPSLPAADENHGTVYLDNLVAASNKNTDPSNENGENTLGYNSPAIIAPGASASLVDDEDDEKVISKDRIRNSEEDYGTVKSTNSKKTPKEIEVDPIVSENGDTEKIRSKRTPHGGGGGYGVVGVPVFVVYGGGGGGGRRHHGHGGRHYGGGGHGYQPNYQNGGGYYPGGGGWGGGSQSYAYAASGSSSY